MLTGDKFETAENIAASCRLIDPDQPNVEVIRLHNKAEVEALYKQEAFTEKCK